jgi:hypothetical protein
MVIIKVYVIPRARNNPKSRTGGIEAVKKDRNATNVVNQARNIAIPT